MTDEELEKEIDKKKQMLSDYQRIAEIIKPSDEEFQKQIDCMLDDLIALRKKIKK